MKWVVSKIWTPPLDLSAPAPSWPNREYSGQSLGARRANSAEAQGKLREAGRESSGGAQGKFRGIFSGVIYLFQFNSGKMK